MAQEYFQTKSERTLLRNTRKITTNRTETVITTVSLSNSNRQPDPTFYWRWLGDAISNQTFSILTQKLQHPYDIFRFSRWRETTDRNIKSYWWNYLEGYNVLSVSSRFHHTCLSCAPLLAQGWLRSEVKWKWSLAIGCWRTRTFPDWVAIVVEWWDWDCYTQSVRGNLDSGEE